MTGAPEEEMTIEEEGEAWMMDHAVVVMTPSPGNPLGDLEAGVNGRRPERRAGVLLVVKTKKREMTKEEKDLALETVVHKGTIPGGEQVQRKEAHGGNLAKTSLTPMIAVLTAVKKIAGMSGNKERHHPEPMMTEPPGVVEVRIRGKSSPGTGTVMQMEIKVGVGTKTFVAQKTRQMMTAGPPSAAEHPIPHPLPHPLA